MSKAIGIVLLAVTLVAGTSSLSAEKRDIRGLRPGMTVDELNNRAKEMNIGCVKGRGWTGFELECIVNDKEVFGVRLTEALEPQVVREVALLFNSDLTLTEIAAAVKQQYGLGDSTAQGGFSHVWQLGEGYYLRLGSGAPLKWMVSLGNSKIDKRDEEAREAKRLSANPPPKF